MERADSTGSIRMLDNIRALTVFAKVAELGSFRSGAKALGLSPSVASHHISNLETQVGTALLYRSTRRLALTAAGEQLLERVQPLIQTAETALDELTASTGAVVGPLRLTMPTPVAFGQLMPVIARFRTENPGIELAITIADGQQDMVKDGFDVALRMGWHEPGAMPSIRLYSEQCVLVTSPAYLSGRAMPDGPRALDDWDWVHHRAGPRQTTFRHPRYGAAVAGNIAHGATVDAAIGVLRLVIAGTGVAKLPLSIAKDSIASGELVRLLEDWTPPSADVRAFWPASAPRQAAARRLVEYLREGIARGSAVEVARSA